ncbi:MULTISPECIES: DUF3667 domain-containing protein [unclassified Tenacibaculum]|uniref:DUF3667 domain-containing protein n=1 Tax=unclassified Tenacibaculum TaxID=2635139 RepID=UPI001F20756A|nr:MULTISPECIES: DUF3667 domain-containing protein [unclassified Tenacibaculum]MCF2873495.1 DUF3667 domain-containing protein [Tenacibaculum sp. Cn5-1]MCF2933651.1 DUF3667 domain-containing protein [Tenacibaculum sp. Cn5-34]MCG7509767.1 DUF3667 domain-containing protein [Tenacibaculum sp. Cn5-46]
MNCKNCNEVLEVNDHFCDNCGAKIIKERITFRFLMVELFAVLGFDSLFFKTLKKTLQAPQDVLNEYMNGVRRRYVNPFAYLAVGAALSLIIYNFFSEDYIRMQGSLNESQVKEIKETANKDLSNVKNLSEKELRRIKAQQQIAKKQIQFMNGWVGFVLNNFNIMTFLFLPFYALMSKLTYPKPYNYGEHIVMNAYIQGTMMFISIITFFLAMLIHPVVFSASFFLTIVYYLYVFHKLFKHNFWRSFLKLLRFILVLILLVIILAIIGGIIGLIIGKFFPSVIPS